MMRLETLLRDARAGRPRAWSRLAKVLSERLYAYFLHKTSDHEAQDLAQIAILRTFEGLPAVKFEERLEGWLFGVARNVWRERERKDARHAARQDEVVALADVPRTSLTSAARWAQLVRFLNEEIGRLPDNMRIAVENELAEEKVRVLADLLGVPRTTVQDWRTKGIELVTSRMLKRTEPPTAAVSKLTAASTPPS